MAMSSVIRKSFHEVVPRTLGAVTSSRILSESITNVQRGCFAISERSFVRVTDSQKQADEELLASLNPKFEVITLSASHDLQKITRCSRSLKPENFPFQVQFKSHELAIKLTRKFAGENIVVKVKEPWNPDGKDITPCSSHDDDENLSTDSSDEEKPETRSINERHCPLTVSITKECGQVLELHCRAYVDSIAVESIAINGDTVEVSSCLKDYWKQFLEIRGIEDSTCTYLLDVMIRRSRHVRLEFLYKFRSFVLA